MTQKDVGHTHKDEQGRLVKCYHECIQLLKSWQFWIGVTLSFPFEHILWSHVWPFSIIGEVLKM